MSSLWVEKAMNVGQLKILQEVVTPSVFVCWVRPFFSFAPGSWGLDMMTMILEVYGNFD